MPNKKCILCILDGWGIAAPSEGNAITLANPESFNYLLEHFPNTTLTASGPDVGLPQDQDGNSETGHLNIGAGRTVYQDLSQINMYIADGSFFTNKVLLDSVKHLNSYKSRLHLLGLIGASGVHASNDHLYALLLFAKLQGIKDVYIHLITDGRDSPPDNAPIQIKALQEKIKEIGVGKIATIMGRYYAMDRDKNLDRTQKAYEALVNKPISYQKDIYEYISYCYGKNLSDEFIPPAEIEIANENSRVSPADCLIFYNFRTDRPRQLTELFLSHPLANIRYVTMTKYRDDFNNPYIFVSQLTKDTLGEVISRMGKKQLRMAETEKIAMVTYFFNGQQEVAFGGEDREFIASPKVATYDQKPDMSTTELVEKFAERYKSTDYSLAVINIACPDMVAHTGKIDKAIDAIKAADSAVTSLMKLARETDSFLFITADHGNAEELINLQTGKVDTEHSTSMVPLIVYHPTINNFKLNRGKLGDVAPTILKLLEIEKPHLMTGNNLIV
jgi:2,3-bisphosphoglycerate-independent phosphoglycerate mutase